VVSLFPTVFNAKLNQAMMEDVDETELKQVLASFQKCKSLGSGWAHDGIFSGFLWAAQR
jgi:hypothetical protein